MLSQQRIRRPELWWDGGGKNHATFLHHIAHDAYFPRKKPNARSIMNHVPHGPAFSVQKPPERRKPAHLFVFWRYFPYSVLEIKLREDKKTPPWFTELLDQGLIQDVPKFSKFLHGAPH